MANENDFEYVNGMILYFDRQGNLKEQINDTPLRQGNSGVNKIYVYWEEGTDENIIGLWSRYTRAELDSLVSVPTATTYFDEYRVINKGRIPYDSKRDLKFFKYYQDYKFFEITIPDSVLGVGDTTWLCSLWFVLDKDNDRSNNGITHDPNENVSGYNESEVNIYGMGGITFYVIPSGFSIAPDENINVAQWNYLMGKLDYLHNLFDLATNGITENIKSFEGRATDKTGLAFTDETENNEPNYYLTLGGDFYNVYINDRRVGEVSFEDLIDDLEGVKLDIPLLAKDMVVSMDTSNYQITFTLKNLNNQTISTQTIDLPLESVVVSGSYDSVNKQIVLTLQNGNVINIPVSDLVNGLVSQSDFNSAISTLQTAINNCYTKNQTYNQTEINALLGEKASASDLTTLTTRVGTLETNSAFTYDSVNDEYDSKKNINLGNLNLRINDFSKIIDVGNNNNLSNYLKAIPTGKITLHGTSNYWYELLGDLHNDVYKIKLRDFTYLYDKANQNSLKDQLDAKANINDINSLASSKIDYVKVNGTSLTKTTLNNEVSVNIDLTSYATNTNLKTYAKSLEVSMNTTTYVATFLLKDGDGNTLSTQTLDLPLESVVVNGTYDSTNQKIVLTLQNGNTIDIPVASLISGLASQSDLNALTTRVGTLETNSAFNKANFINLYFAKGSFDLQTYDLSMDFSKLKDKGDYSNLKASLDNIGFTYNSTTQEYEAKSDFNMKGLDIDGVMELFSTDVYTANLYGLNDNDILLRNDIDGNQKTIKDIYLETPSITLTPPADSSAFIWVGDESILSVDENQHIVLGCENAGSLTFETQNNSVDFDDLMTTLNAKANANEVLYSADASITAVANKIVKRDASGNIEGNYLKGTWLYTSGATDYASWTDVFVNNGGWLYKRSKAGLKADLVAPQLLGYTQNSGMGNLQFDFDVDLTNKQGLGVLTYGNCQILVNLYGLTKGTTYYQNCLYRYTGSTGTTGLKNGMLSYRYYDAGSNITRATFTFYSLNSDGSIGSIQGSSVTYTAYLFLVNLK